MNRIRNLSAEILSDNWYTLKKYSFEYLNKTGEWQPQEREAYDRGNGAAILLYNKAANKIILTKQFRLPTYVNGNKDGFLIESCAGLLDDNNPEDCIKQECIEETGYHLDKVERVFEAYMSPGSVTEILYFFIAEYSTEQKQSQGGGLASEQEEIEVMELSITEALAMIDNGQIKDAKTIMLIYHLLVKGRLQK